MTTNTNPTTIKVINVQEKSLLVAFLLTLFLGPLGMLYSTIIGGLIMIAVYLVIIGLSVVTMGMATVLFLPAWIICIAWGMIAAKNRNRMIAATGA